MFAHTSRRRQISICLNTAFWYSNSLIYVTCPNVYPVIYRTQVIPEMQFLHHQIMNKKWIGKYKTNLLRKIVYKYHFNVLFALISRHFIGLSRYFRLWRVMHQIKEPVLIKFNSIELKIQEILFYLVQIPRKESKYKLKWYS